MKTQVLAITTSAFLLGFGVLAVDAQQRPGSPMQQSETQMHQSETGTGGCGGMMGEQGMGMGRGTMGGMHHGMMEHRAMMNPIAMRMIFALMDSDGDGTISLEEWQAAHAKIFKAMDADKDGTVSFEEMMNFFRGTARSAPHQ